MDWYEGCYFLGLFVNSLDNHSTRTMKLKIAVFLLLAVNISALPIKEEGSLRIDNVRGTAKPIKTPSQNDKEKFYRIQVTDYEPNADDY